MPAKNQFLRRVRKASVFYAFCVVSSIVGILPRAVVLAMGGFFGRLASFILPSFRRQAEHNLEQAFGNELSSARRKKIARDVFVHFGKTIFETIAMADISLEQLATLVPLNDMRIFGDLLSEGKGSIAQTAHFGNWELLGMCFGLLGYPTHVIARRVRDERFEQYICDVRRSKGLNVLTRGVSVRTLLRLLKNKQILGIVPDVDTDSVDGVFVEFFHRPTWTPIGPAVLARQTGMPIVPCYLVREGLSYRIIVNEPIYPVVTDDRTRDIREITQAWTMVLERHIRAYPDQWIWIHDRWKTQPQAASESLGQ